LFGCGEVAVAGEEDVVVLNLGFVGDGEEEGVFYGGLAEWRG
jgi:hypothetical protein